MRRILLLLFLIACVQVPQTHEPPIVVSFYPLADFSQKIVGNTTRVITLIASGAEPHDFEPTTQDVITLHNAQLFIINGVGLEGWAAKLAQSAGQQHVIVAASGITLIPAVAESGANDPHVWLSPVLAQQEVRTITDALIAANPSRKETYTQNSVALLSKLTKLDLEYTRGLSSCSRLDIFTSHAAFAYLARQYNLSQIPISGLSPDEEPSPQQLISIAQLARQKNATTIFFETLISPKLSSTIAEEIGAHTLVLNPIEGLTAEEQQAGKDYFSLMEENLNNLRTALDCV